MLATSMQPKLFPPLYAIERLARADVCVVLTEAQYSRVYSRTDLMGRDGKVLLSVPLSKAGRRPMNEIALHDSEGWVESTKGKMRALYGKLPSFDKHLTDLEPVFIEARACSSFSELGWACFRSAIDLLGLRCCLKDSLSLVPERPERATDWLACLTEALGSREYFQGRNSMNTYFEPEYFARRGIRLMCQDFAVTAPYAGFPDADPTISWIDFLFKHGREELAHTLQTRVSAHESGTVVPWP